jgi:hypothetical protein
MIILKKKERKYNKKLEKRGKKRKRIYHWFITGLIFYILLKLKIIDRGQQQ